MSDEGRLVTEVDPEGVRRVHLLGVAGTGMGAFAGMLKAAGYEVSGSDEDVYPPMSEMLAKWGVDVMTPYRPENLDAAAPDLVIVGNVIRRVNPEATAVRERGIPHTSFPAALGSLVLAGRHSVVVAGTHGKTTTSALLAHVLVHAGRDPSFLIGGVALNYGANYRLGKGEHVVLEGDEYDTAYFDKGPKFLHYRARTALVTSLEFDHADIYRDIEHYESAFSRFARTIPREGMVAVSNAYPRAVELVREGCAGRVVTYGVGGSADYRAESASFSEAGAEFRVVSPDGMTQPMRLPMTGMHNVENAAGVYAVSRGLGLSDAEIAAGFESFAGIRRRQEVRGEPAGVLVIDDFAHHPTAVRETIRAMRDRYPSRRLWAVFEQRSNTSRRNIHQEAYARAFDGADRVILRVPEHHHQVPLEEELDASLVADDLNRAGVTSSALQSVEAIVELLGAEAERGDVVLVMSNGSFGGLIPSLLERLSRR
jgi:UDP-N-acetylmuramate: L-alanyl-gamma-D-glutamyl-meso-diaminopimelate ligase